MKRTILPPMMVLLALILAAGCGKSEGLPKEEDKKDNVQNKGGPNEEAGGNKGDGNVGLKNGSGPFKEKTPDPKVAAQKQAEDKKQASLTQLCKDAFSDVKATRRKALTQLEADYPKLEPFVTDLSGDTNPEKLAKAFEEIGKMGPGIRGDWPALTEGTARAFHFEDYRLSGVISAGIDAMVKIAPGEAAVVEKLIELAHKADAPARGKEPAKDRSGIRVAAVTALGKVAQANGAKTQGNIIHALKKAVADPSVAERAAQSLGEIARTCPFVRRNVDAALHAALGNKVDKVRETAVVAMFFCGAGVSEKTKTKLGELKFDDPTKEVRDAAVATLREVARQYLVVPQLDKVGIVEGKLPMPLYQAAFALVEGLKVEDAFKTLQNAPHDADSWQTLTGLARLANHGNQDQSAIRKAALEILGDWTKPEEKLRKDLVPIFLVGLKDAGTAEVAKTGLVRCGAETVRLAKAAKLNLDLVAMFRAKVPESNPYVRTGVAEGLGEFRPTAKKDLEPLLFILEFPGSSAEKDMVTRAAAKALLHLGPEQMEFAEALNAAYVKTKDDKTATDLKRTIQNMGLEAGAGRFWSSLLLHAKTDSDMKKKILGMIVPDPYAKEPTKELFAAFGKEADPKAKEIYIDQWLGDESKFKKASLTVSSFNNKEYKDSIEAEEICRCFGPDAKKVAALLVEDLKGYCKRRKIAFDPQVAARALGEVGPVPGLKILEALEQAIEAQPGTFVRSRENEIRSAARAAREKFLSKK